MPHAKMLWQTNFSQWSHEQPKRIFSVEVHMANPRARFEVDFGRGAWETKDFPGVFFNVIWLEKTGELVAQDATHPTWKMRRFTVLGVFQNEGDVVAVVKPLLDKVADRGEKASLDDLFEAIVARPN